MMGFFSKIKTNLNHGGVKIDLQAPASVSMQDAQLPVTITITNTDSEQRMVKRVSAEIFASSQNRAFNQPGSVNNTNQVVRESVARADNTEQFVIMPGETKTVQLNIVMNAGAVAGAQLPENSAMAQVAGALQKLQSVSEALNNTSYTYSLQGSADVDGVALDPSKSMPLQVLKPGQIGTGFNVQL
jgi:hypothetical protein